MAAFLPANVLAFGERPSHKVAAVGLPDCCRRFLRVARWRVWVMNIWLSNLLGTELKTNNRAAMLYKYFL